MMSCIEDVSKYKSGRHHNVTYSDSFFDFRHEFDDGSMSTEKSCLIYLKHLVYPLGTNVLRSDLGVYVLWGGEGLWREESSDISKTQSSLSTSQPEKCYPSSDFIRHGSGEGLSDKYMPSKSIQCSKTYTKDVRRGKGESEVCDWLTIENEYLNWISSGFCWFNSPVCYGSIPRRSHYVKRSSTTGLAKVFKSTDTHINNGVEVEFGNCLQRMWKHDVCHNLSSIIPLKPFRFKINYSLY